MKLEIEIPDMEQIIQTYYIDKGDWSDDYTFGGEGYNSKDIAKAFVDIALQKFVDGLYDDISIYDISHVVNEEARAMIKEHKEEIIDKAIEKVSEAMLRRKEIVSEMPKKSEVANISKEWEQYFLGLIDKAIAKRFK